jgi:bifunctional non-homologous end joining protein LigD
MRRIELKRIAGARQAAFPSFIAPQLATLVKEPPSGSEWLHELKFDGYRMLCHCNGDDVRFWSRNRKDWTAKFPQVAKALQKFPARQVVLDGEIVIVDAAGRTSFQRLQQAMGKSKVAAFIYQIFDVLYLDGYLLTDVELRIRKELLRQLFLTVPEGGSLRYSDHFEGDGRKFFAQACDYGIEGIVSKRADSHYESTRNKNWLKIKCGRSQEFVVAGYTPSVKGMAGFGSLILGVYEKGKLQYAGRVGTGFSLKQRVELAKRLDKISREKSPFAVKPKDPGLRNAHWAEPKLVADVSFTEWTDEGSVRHPSFQGLREDKSPGEVRREIPK